MKTREEIEKRIELIKKIAREEPGIRGAAYQEIITLNLVLKDE